MRFGPQLGFRSGFTSALSGLLLRQVLFRAAELSSGAQANAARVRSELKASSSRS